MKILFLFFAILAMALDASAKAETFLYGDYYAGMTREAFSKTGAAQCDEFSGGITTCNRRNVVFASEEWTQFFEFNKDGLCCVAFGRPLSLAIIDNVLAWFEGEDYIPIKAEAGKNSVNYAFLYDKRGESEFKKETEIFNRGLPSADLLNSYLIKQSFLEELTDNGKLPANAIIASIGGSKSLGTFFVIFEPASNFTVYTLE